MRRTSALALAAYAFTSAILAVSWSPAWQSASRTDFGRVPRRLHAYLLICAAAAFACNVVFVLAVTTRDGEYAEAEVLAPTLSLCAYNLLLLAFLPLRRTDEKWPVRILLGAAACLQLFAAAVGATTGSPVLAITGGIGAAHCVVNDGIVYAMLF